MYEIIGIKQNKLYRLLNLQDASFTSVSRECCIDLAKQGKIKNAKCVNGSLRGINCNLRLLNNPNYVKSKERKLNSKADRSILADALGCWVYEQDSSTLSKYYEDLKTPLSGVFYRGRILHKSMLKVGAKLYLDRGLISWTTSIHVAKTFAETHMWHAKEEKFDLQADVGEYIKAILCIKSENGSMSGLDILTLVKEFSDLIDEDAYEVAKDEFEILFNSLKQPELKIVRIEKLEDSLYKLYCNVLN